jgi:hypothetical protein
VFFSQLMFFEILIRSGGMRCQLGLNGVQSVRDLIAIINIGIVAKSGSGSDRVSRARHRVESLQMALLSWRYHSLVCAVVPEVSDLICAHGRDGARTGLIIHSSSIWWWVQIYGPELDKRCRAHLKRTK